jgi:hypothetical protein
MEASESRAYSTLLDRRERLAVSSSGLWEAERRSERTAEHQRECSNRYERIDSGAEWGELKEEIILSKLELRGCERACHANQATQTQSLHMCAAVVTGSNSGDGLFRVRW